jgi:hypothetical protein
MWLMSQEQRLWPERSPEPREGRGEVVPPLGPERRVRAQAARDFGSAGSLALPIAKEVAQAPIAQKENPGIQYRALDKATAEGPWITEATSDFPQEDLTVEDLALEGSDVGVQLFELSATDDSYPSDASTSIDDAPRSLIQRFADWRVKLRFQRADLYLGVAVFVAALALLWPAAGAPRPAALGPWERALVTLGIAEAPAPLVHVQGDPGLAVWVDPHTALYYCPGEEQYGKTADGRFSPQREAQMDSFQPAGRSACE